MTDINLLPWREKQRERAEKTFTVLIVSVVGVALFIVGLIYLYTDSSISAQAYRNQRLQKEIAYMDTQIQEIRKLKTLRRTLISRMKIVQKLQATRPLTVHLFEELIHILPDGIYLSHEQREGNRVTILGYAQSNSNVSTMMRNIEKNHWIQDPVLTEIKHTDEMKKLPGLEEHSEFKLSFTVKPENNVVYQPRVPSS